MSLLFSQAKIVYTKKPAADVVYMADVSPITSALSGPPPKFGRELASSGAPPTSRARAHCSPARALACGRRRRRRRVPPVVSDKETRDKAVKAVSRYLKQANGITFLELSKVWKALFYCMWHSDKRPVQADLAERLTALLHVMPPAKQPLFVQVFWATMTREWHGIDRLRLDKFYMLMRLALGHMLAALCEPEDGLDLARVREFAALLRAGPLALHAPRGVKFFLVDNYLPALRKALPEEAGGEVWMVLVEPFLELMGDADETHLLQRATDQLLTPLLDVGQPTEGEEEEEEEEEEVAKLPVVLVELSERLFDLASDPKTREENREHIYKLQRTAEERAEASGATKDVKAKGAKGGKAKAPPKPKVRAAAGGGAAAAAEKTSVLKGMISKKAAKAKAVEPEPMEEEPEEAPAAASKPKKAAKAAKSPAKPTPVPEPTPPKPSPAPKASKASKAAATEEAGGEAEKPAKSKRARAAEAAEEAEGDTPKRPARNTRSTPRK